MVIASPRPVPSFSCSRFCIAAVLLSYLGTSKLLLPSDCCRPCCWLKRAAVCLCNPLTLNKLLNRSLRIIWFGWLKDTICLFWRLQSSSMSVSSCSRLLSPYFFFLLHLYVCPEFFLSFKQISVNRPTSWVEWHAFLPSCENINHINMQ